MPQLQTESQEDRSETVNIVKRIALIVVLSIAMLVLLAWLGPTLGSMMRTTYTGIGGSI